MHCHMKGLKFQPKTLHLCTLKSEFQTPINRLFDQNKIMIK